jgi:hypothetical protein
LRRIQGERWFDFTVWGAGAPGRQHAVRVHELEAALQVLDDLALVGRDLEIGHSWSFAKFTERISANCGSQSYVFCRLSAAVLNRRHRRGPNAGQLFAGYLATVDHGFLDDGPELF